MDEHKDQMPNVPDFGNIYEGVQVIKLSRPSPHKCIKCGKQLTDQLVHKKGELGYFCSEQCRIYKYHDLFQEISFESKFTLCSWCGEQVDDNTSIKLDHPEAKEDPILLEKISPTFCSSNCQSRWVKLHWHHKCAQCKNKFHLQDAHYIEGDFESARAGRLKGALMRFCSKKCADDKKNGVPYQLRVCDQCGKSFNKSQTHFIQSEIELKLQDKLPTSLKKFCSGKCHDEHLDVENSSTKDLTNENEAV